MKRIEHLNEAIAFPSPLAMDCTVGPIAVGGDLSPRRLLLAYSMGIFPWYEEGMPILWWCPDPRLVLFPRELKVSRSLSARIRRGAFTVTLDEGFEATMRACAETHTERHGATWITEEMIAAYTRLHEMGYAHSVEAWRDGELVGGLYGIAMGKMFFGESMFARETDASKVAFVTLVRRLYGWGFELIDAQVRTPHLVSLGAREISLAEFLARLDAALALPGRPGSWKGEL